MLTDIHTHAFHPKIAARAVTHLNDYYKVHCEGLGTIEDLQKRAARGGIERCVVLCAATEPAQVIPANRYAAQLQREYPGITAFGTLHPGYEDWEQQLDWLKAHGIQGLKLHPDFQHFWLDDPRLLPIFEHIGEDFVVLFHIGDKTPPRQTPSCPYKLAAIVKNFPRLRVIGAHFGGYQQWQYAEEVLIGKPIWLDTSSTSEFLSESQLRRLLRKHDPERLFFGSDYPLYDPVEEIQRLQRMGGLGDAQMEQLMSNADKILRPVLPDLLAAPDADAPPAGDARA